MSHVREAPAELTDFHGASAPPLELSGIAHRFGRRWVLKGVACRVDSGEVVAIEGPNGAGKTTLIRIAATVLRPSRGGGRVDGMDLLREGAGIRERMGLLGHSPALYEDLNPIENLRFALRMRGEEAGREACLRLLDRVGLEAHAERPVRAFSSGMRRRLALARVLTAPPRLLLMDEPYASLDRQGVDLVNGVVREVAAAGGGVLLATHDLHSGEPVTDRMVTLDDGVIRASAH
jgi:heme exporter protein A